MHNFDFKNGTKIIFGKDQEIRVGEECKAVGTKVLLHYGGGSIKKSGLYDRVMESLKKAGLDVVELGGVQPNPRLSLVREGLELCKREKVDMILAVGGGSVIDSAKAIGAGYHYEGDVWDFYCGKASPEKMLPLGVVLTIPAAGSESSTSSVISNEEEKRKYGTGGLCMRPDFAILNPELTFTLPDYQTACGIADMLAHVMERYFSKVEEVELTDRMCEAVMKTIIHQAYRLVEEPQNYDARAEIMWAGTIAHNDLLNTGRGGDWASHGIEHELSAMYDVAHGAGLAVVFPAWMKHVYKEDTRRFLRFAHEVFNVDYNYENPEETILKGIAALENFFSNIGLPIRLKEMNVDPGTIKEMAALATKNDSIKLGEFKLLGQSDVEQILTLAK